MAALVHLIRNKQVVWRDIAGEVVIVERDSHTVRVLNKTASLIWVLADGTRQMDTIAAEVCSKFDVTAEQARADVEEFIQQLLEAGLITMEKLSETTKEVYV